MTTTTDTNGDFQFLNVKVGTYEVTAERQGFATAVVEGVRVEVNARQRLDLSLQPGAITESVVVTDAASLLETETSVRGQVIGSRQVVNLPLNGRNYADLALLVPGVRESNLNQNSIASKRDASFNVNGLRSTYNNFLLDGIDNNSYGTSNQGFSSQVVQLSPDAVTEFKVETNNYSAEFGRSGGAVVNASLKSGTNAFHGSLWEFHRNTALNARGFFANRTNAPKPTLIRNQFGGALGGPIIRNRTFFFVDYEGFREVSSEVRFATVPTLAQRQGNLGLAVRNPLTGEAFASGVIPQDRITPFARQVLADLPAPNLPGTANNFSSVAKNCFYNDKGDLKLDHRFNERVNAFVRASHRKANNFEAPTIPGPSGGDANGFVRVLNQQFAGGVTFTVSPTSLLEFRMGVSRTKAGKEPPLIGGASMNQLYGITGLPETPDLTGGLTAQLIGGFANLGRQATNPQFQNPTVVDPRVNYSWLMGSHSLKTGYEYQAINTEVNDVNPLYGRDGYGGQFSRVAGGANNLYNFADFLFGARSQYALVTPFVFDLRQRMHFLYVQDDFKVNNRLTLSLGLRYEYATPQYEANNRLSNYDPATNSIIASTDGSIADRALVEPDRNNFAPRAGLAFQIDDKTVLRTAYGIGYIHFNRSGGANLLPINGPQVVLAVIEQNPSQSSFRPTQAGYPAGLTDPSNFNPLTATVFHLPRDTRTGYVQSWHMTVQRELTKNTLLDVAYVGNHAVKLLLFGDLNQARPLRAGETLATASLQSRRPIAGFSAISTGFPVGFSNYHGLQMKFEHRASRGLYLLNSFTVATRAVRRRASSCGFRGRTRWGQRWCRRSSRSFCVKKASRTSRGLRARAGMR